MKIFGFEISLRRAAGAAAGGSMMRPEIRALMYSDDMMSRPWVPVKSKSFNGEKTPGELGNPINLVPDYRSLRFRAYEANLSTVVIKIVTGKFFKWVVGKGLKFQSEPNEDVLRLEGIKDDQTEFRNNTKGYFRLWCKSKTVDFGGMKNLHQLAREAFKTAFLGGDCLVVLRVDDNYNLTVQVIDGQHVGTPLMSTQYMEDAKERGNIILHGIELDNKGTHIAYYVVKQSTTNLFGEWERIEARGKTSGCLMAWMIYGDKHRIDHHRGIPSITAILETVEKLDRYTEASVSAAEERAKVPWSIEHDKYSDGENPVLGQLKRNLNVQAAETGYELAAVTAKNISVSENKTVYNLPVGSKFKALDSTSEMNYEAFFKAVFVQICASIDIPPEVALQQYNSNYSASRAAINGWGYIIDIYRELFSDDFYQPVYNLWLYLHVLKNKVKANGYVKAVNMRNNIVVESYSGARFTGANMPHIDPLKEANAIRTMLGDKTTPLMTYDQATDQYGLGEFDENIKKINEERKLIPDLLPGQVPGADAETEPDPDDKMPAKPKKDATDSED